MNVNIKNRDPLIFIRNFQFYYFVHIFGIFKCSLVHHLSCFSSQTNASQNKKIEKKPNPNQNNGILVLRK